MPDISVTVGISLPVSIATIVPVAAISTNLTEALSPIGLPIAETVRDNENDIPVLLAGIIEPKITYSKTDGVPITSGGSSGGGTYWITG